MREGPSEEGSCRARTVPTHRGWPGGARGTHPTVLLHLGASLPGLGEDGADHALGARVAGGRAVGQAAVCHTGVVGLRL